MNSQRENVTVTFELKRVQALALAEFVKRTMFTDCQDHAVAEDEAYAMMDGVNAVMRGLGDCN